MSLADFAEKITHYCRTGELDPSLEVDHNRLKVYLEHFRKKIKRVLKRAFPLTYHLLAQHQWDEMIEAFLAQEENSSPFYWTVPYLFIGFVMKNHYADRLNIPYLEDLLDFEWLEIEMYMMPDYPIEAFTHQGHILDEILYLNPESRIVTYSYPVFEKKTLPRTMKEGIYFLLAFRHPESKEVRFIGLSPFFYRVLELLTKGNLAARVILRMTAEQFKLDPELVLMRGEKFLKDLYDQRGIYGFKGRN